jgi:hypothetical protein
MKSPGWEPGLRTVALTFLGGPGRAPSFRLHNSTAGVWFLAMLMKLRREAMPLLAGFGGLNLCGDGSSDSRREQHQHALGLAFVTGVASFNVRVRLAPEAATTVTCWCGS